MTELEKLLATRRDARVAVLGPADVVSKYIAETEKNLAATVADAERSGSILVFDEADGLFGREREVEAHDGPVLIGARSLQSIPDELRAGLVVVKAPRVPWWRVLLRV
jgi:SpoVK/Ycf46/Vps4 family AAA+-type ATPase